MQTTELVSKLKILVHEERRITSEILKYLHLVEVRRIFAHMGYPSLFEFCLKELGYSEGAAQRRISAMRLVKDLPEVKVKIESGVLSLSVVSQVQRYFKKKKSLNKPLARTEKLDLLLSLENSSARACEKALLTLEPEMATRDKERFVSAESLEIKITVDKEFIENLETLKNYLSHKMPSATTKDILSLALRELVKKQAGVKGVAGEKPNAIAKPGAGAKPKWPRESLDAGVDSAPEFAVALKKGFVPPTLAVAKTSLPPALSLALPPHDTSRYISVHVRRAVWQRDDGRCGYKDPVTQHRCDSKRFLEIDHVFPKSQGGSNKIENLQLLCDTHNRLKGATVVNRRS